MRVQERRKKNKRFVKVMEKLNVAKAKNHKSQRPQTARSYDEHRKKNKRDDSPSHSDESDSESSDDDCWEEVDNAKTVEEAMYELWKNDPETFYIHGEHVERMIRYRLERGWRAEDID